MEVISLSAGMGMGLSGGMMMEPGLMMDGFDGPMGGMMDVRI